MKKKFNKITLVKAILFIVLLTPNALIAHDGPVDIDGCHLDREGRRHCH